MKHMERGSVAIFYSNDLMPRSGDQTFPYRQESTLFALTGIDQPGTILVLCRLPNKNSFKEILFILPKDPDHVIWHGERLTNKQASTISGMDTIRTVDHWNDIMDGIIGEAKSIYVNIPEKGKSGSPFELQNERMAALLKKNNPELTLRSAFPILQTILMIKHQEEIEMVKQAVHVTGLAFKHLLQRVRPGMNEYEAEAELTYILHRNGCRHAFEPIVASGKSACILHSISNDNIIKPGTLVLIDFGAEYANMASDMTRTIPAGGKFSNEQRKIYNSVLHVLNEVTGMMRPGVTIDQLNKEAGKLIEGELIMLKIISKSEVKRQDPQKPVWKKYFMHGISHHLGYDVHDTSDKNLPLRSGMILTCEPGIYLPELKTGIRLENDILITKKGPHNLMKDIPISTEEIESLMNS